MPRSSHAHRSPVPGVDFVQKAEVIVVHCAVPRSSCGGGGRGDCNGRNRLSSWVTVLCGSDWLSISAGGVPAVQLALGGKVDPSSSFAILSLDAGWGNPHSRRDTSPSAASSQSSEGSYALVSAQPEALGVKLYLSKSPPGMWEGPIVGPLFALPSLDLPLDGTVLNIALGPSDSDWDCTYHSSSGSPSPLSGSTQQLPSASIASRMENSTELQSAIVEAFADLQAVRDEFTPPPHNLAPRPSRPPHKPRQSSRPIRHYKDSDSDAGGSQASATILAVHPPLTPLAPALVPPPSVELVFPDPLAELGLAEVTTEGDVSSCSADSRACPRKDCRDRHSRTGTAHPLIRNRRSSTAAASSAGSTTSRLRTHRRKHRRHRLPTSRMSAQSANLGLSVGLSVIAVSAVALLWWRRAVRTA